jgi:signal transduction histidine kinase/CheY-like chemotaxis protein
MENITSWLRKLTLTRDNKTTVAIIKGACSQISKASEVAVCLLTANETLVRSLLDKIAVVDSYGIHLSQEQGIFSHYASMGLTKWPHSVWVFPIRIDEPIGILICAWPSDSPCELDEESIQIVLESGAIALENADVHEQLSRQMAERSAELAIAKQEAESVSQLKNSFLSAASHDLRQPLQQITSLINILSRQGSSSDANEHLSRIKQIVRGMDKLLGCLLNLDRLEQGKIEPNYKDIRLSTVLSSLEDDFAQQAHNKNLIFNVFAYEGRVHTDEDLLLQILRNLVGNAIKYTEQGSVDVSCKVASSIVEVCIQDTGPGIAIELHDRVFEPFYQIRDERQKSSSFGLGLSLVKALAETISIPILLSSEPGKGTRFTLSLPKSADELEQFIDQGNDMIRTETSVRGSVLYMEDDEILILSMTTLLEIEGFLVISAESGAEAFERISALEQDIDIIVTDKRLKGGQDGVEWVIKIREVLGYDVPTILLTGYTERTVHQEALKTVQAVLCKPIDVDFLVSEIEKYIKKKPH